MGWARCILEWVSDGIASDGVLVGLGTLHELWAKTTCANVLLGVVPGTATVAHRDSKLHTGDESTGEQTSACVLSKTKTCNQWRANDEKAGPDHFAQRGICGDLNASV